MNKTTPHIVSWDEFTRDLIRCVKKLSAEEKADFRLSLYLWASVRLAKLKPASEKVQ